MLNLLLLRCKIGLRNPFLFLEPYVNTGHLVLTLTFMDLCSRLSYWVSPETL